MQSAARVVWLIIAIWSVLVCVVETVDWIKWKPNKDESFGKAVTSIFMYRIKMMFRVIVPALLTIAGILAFGLR